MDRLRAQLAEIARSEVAYSRQERRMGTSAVASPVAADGVTVAALAVVGPHLERALAPNGEAVRQAAIRLGRALSRLALSAAGVGKAPAEPGRAAKPPQPITGPG